MVFSMIAGRLLVRRWMIFLVRAGWSSWRPSGA